MNIFRVAEQVYLVGPVGLEPTTNGFTLPFYF